MHEQDCLVEDSQIGTKFRQRSHEVVKKQPESKATNRWWACQETESPCSCLNFQPFSRHQDAEFRVLGWLCRVLLPTIELVGLVFLIIKGAQCWSNQCRVMLRIHFVLCALLSVVVVLSWVLFFVEKIPRVMRLRLLVVPFFGIVWAGVGMAISSGESCLELSSLVLYQSVGLLLWSLFPAVALIAGFYVVAALVLLSIIGSFLWAAVMTVATAACCFPCARRSFGERFLEPYGCRWFGSCGTDCVPEYGMRKDMPCEFFNFVALSARLDLRSQVFSWFFRLVVMGLFAGVSEYTISRMLSSWEISCNHPLHIQFWLAVFLFFVVLLSWDLFLVEKIPKVLRMWCMVLATAGLVCGVYGVSIVDEELAVKGCIDPGLPHAVLVQNIALILGALLPVVTVLAGFYAAIIIGMVIFLVSLVWAGAMSLFTTACCCPCERRTMAERMREPAECQWFGKCGRDCTPVRGGRPDSVPCAVFNFVPIAARTTELLRINPQIWAIALRVLTLAACVSCVVGVGLLMPSYCSPSEDLQLGVTAAYYCLMLLGWLLFIVEKVPRVLRLWVFLEALGAFLWAIYVLSLHVVPGEELDECALPLIAQSVALLLATLFPGIVLVAGFYLLTVIGVIGFLVSFLYACACVCLSYCCPFSMASKRSFCRRLNEPMKCQWFNRCLGLCPPDAETKAEIAQEQARERQRLKDQQAERERTANMLAFLMPSLPHIPHPDTPLRNFYTSSEWDRNLMHLIRDFVD